MLAREETIPKKMPRDKHNPEKITEEGEGLIEASLNAITIVNEERSDKVDFTIVVNEMFTKTRFGVEKSALSLNSTFLREMFDKCSKENDKNAKTEGFRIIGSTKDVVFKALRILSGIVDKDVWTINESVDLIDFGKRYGCDIIVNCALQKFCPAFSDEALSNSQVFTSRYGCAALIEFIRLWRRMLQGDLVCSTETSAMFFWCIRNVWYSWCNKCDTTPVQARITHFMTLETSKYFDAYDICLTSEYIEHMKSSFSFAKNLGELLQSLDKKHPRNTDGNPSSDSSGEVTQAPY